MRYPTSRLAFWTHRRAAKPRERFLLQRCCTNIYLLVLFVYNGLRFSYKDARGQDDQTYSTSCSSESFGGQSTQLHTSQTKVKIIFLCLVGCYPPLFFLGLTFKRKFMGYFMTNVLSCKINVQKFNF